MQANGDHRNHPTWPAVAASRPDLRPLSQLFPFSPVPIIDPCVTGYEVLLDMAIACYSAAAGSVAKNCGAIPTAAQRCVASRHMRLVDHLDLATPFAGDAHEPERERAERFVEGLWAVGIGSSP